MLAVDGGRVTIGGRTASVLGVSPEAFRAWTPPVAAADGAAWSALASGQLVASDTAVSGLGLVNGDAYEVSGASSAQLVFRTSVLLGIPGVDALVSSALSGRLGLVRNAAVLISAPGADLTAMMLKLRAVVGTHGEVVNLVPVATAGKLPVASVVPAGRPGNYLQLYKDAAAEYCPGLSWTVLAAIGEIESGDGANDGPSSAGAEGPMQFMPFTWAAWGIDGFGESGRPDVMDPLDAVPSAARLLCADGAAAGEQQQSAAIFDYNHAAWYVSEVLDLAGEYAREYP